MDVSPFLHDKFSSPVGAILLLIYGCRFENASGFRLSGAVPAVKIIRFIIS
ncbi:hypothetical protein B4098_2604 [Heyndrickxia coagulans]|uniref:Uncharacterized protein n=1 Tax=Heyndrickxia coagulans TaxID=1398 RepID=A0A150JPZ2_HEYCO|nr:hypothetical protein HMPREF3213_00970 [Heyndrickxia coagulans]KYC59363.1 hypothetical protein B4098_2604 [Heyndrickxia coagulans]